MKRIDSSTECTRCGSTVDLLTCELDAFSSYGLHCLRCRDENWKILRRDNEIQ